MRLDRGGGLGRFGRVNPIPFQSESRRWLSRSIATLTLGIGLLTPTFAADAPPVALPAAPAAAALTDAECAEFGRQIAQWINDRDAAQVVRRLDQFAFLDRVTNGLGMSAADERDFRAGMLSSIGAGLTTQLSEMQQARFLRIQQVAGEKRALLRMIPARGGVVYMAFICHRRDAGPVVWSDAFNYALGENVGAAIRRLAMNIMAGVPTGLSRLTGTPTGMAAHLPKFQQMTAAMQRGDFQAVWDISETIPADVRTDNVVLMLRLQAAQRLEEAKYLAVIGEWEKAHPGDPTLDFVAIDGSFARKDYAGALRHAEAFNRQIGGDAYVDFLAANILLAAGRLDEARSRARAILAGEPTLMGAYDVLISVGIKTKAYGEVVTALNDLTKQAVPRAGLIDAMAADETYADFRRSPEYRAWTSGGTSPAGGGL